MLNLFLGNIKICLIFFNNFSISKWSRWLKPFPIEYKSRLPHSKYHGCLRPGNTRSQGISSHDTCADLVHRILWFWHPKHLWKLDLGQNKILVKIGSDNGLVPDSTKPISEPVLTYHHQWHLQEYISVGFQWIIIMHLKLIFSKWWTFLRSQWAKINPTFQYKGPLRAELSHVDRPLQILVVVVSHICWGSPPDSWQSRNSGNVLDCKKWKCSWI